MKGTVWQKGNEPSHEGPSQALGVELALFVQQLLEGFLARLTGHSHGLIVDRRLCYRV